MKDFRVSERTWPSAGPKVLDAIHRAPHAIGDLRERQSFQMVQDKDRTIVLGQLA